MSAVRQMTNEDLLTYQRLCSICYTYRATQAPEPLPDELLHMRMGAFDDAGNLLSAMMQIPYQVQFEGQRVKLAGIGGVVTDPVHRGEGGVRRLFAEGLPRLYREGHVFSALYPFSHQFYRKFGYETAQFWRNVEIPREALRTDLRRADEIVRVLPEDEDSGMREIYERYIADKHLAVVRDEQMWKDLRRGTPWEDLAYAYVVKMAGKPVAYWIGRMHKEGWRCTLTLKDLAWTCQEGLEAVFAMMRGMNEVSEISLHAQGGFDPRLLVSEPYDLQWKGPSDGMLRIVNVERALVLLPAPPLPGTLHIRVTDDMIPQNDGCFAVTCDGYTLSVTRAEDAAADVACDVRGLATIFAGGYTFDDCVRTGAVKLLNPKRARLAGMLFTRRELHMNQEF